MAIRTKAQLRTAIDAVFASMRKIPAEEARGEFHDWIDSLLDSDAVQAGAGIAVSRDAGVVTIAAGGAAAASGLPVFFGSAAYSAANARITLSGITNPPRPSILYAHMPAALDRAADDLTMLVDGVEYHVVDTLGGGVAARLLTPSALAGFLWRSGDAQSLEILETRPQDFGVVMTWLPETPIDNQAVFEAYVDMPISHGTSMTAEVALPAYTDPDGRTRVFYGIGVPLDAPDVGEVGLVGGLSGGRVGTRVAAWDGWRFMGTGYKWWSFGRGGITSVVGTYRVEFLPYA